MGQLAMDPPKFQDPFTTAAGERRALVALKSLDTLWFNTGSLCNLTCRHCYTESSPKNDRLVYLTAAEVTLDDPLSRGFDAMVLTNARSYTRRGERRGAAQPSALRQILRTRWCRLQPQSYE
jgi:hypothetical protein